MTQGDIATNPNQVDATVKICQEIINLYLENDFKKLNS